LSNNAVIMLRLCSARHQLSSICPFLLPSLPYAGVITPSPARPTARRVYGNNFVDGESLIRGRARASWFGVICLPDQRAPSIHSRRLWQGVAVPLRRRRLSNDGVLSITALRRPTSCPSWWQQSGRARCLFYGGKPGKTIGQTGGARPRTERRRVRRQVAGEGKYAGTQGCKRYLWPLEHVPY